MRLRNPLKLYWISYRVSKEIPLNRVKNNKPPMYALFTVEEKGAKEYIGFGYRVYHQNNSFYAVTFLWADQDDLAVGDPFENKLKVIFSGNLT